MQLRLGLLGFLEKDVENFLEVRNKSLFKDFGGHAIDCSVVLFLLWLHVVVVVAKLVEKDDHVLVLANFLHHEAVNFLLPDRSSVHLLELI